MVDENNIELEVGQYITDGENELLVCSIKEYENKLYVYLINEIKDEGYFYEMTRDGELWKFTKETSPAQIKQLIIHFSDIKNRIKGEQNG